MTLYHVTTERKVRRYHEQGRIIPPVRGFDSLPAAMAWGLKVGRRVILAVETNGHEAHLLPDHHNRLGRAWWIDGEVRKWTCAYSPKDA